MVDAGLTYTAADATLAGNSISWVRPLGDKTKNIHFNSTESFIWHAKCAHVLVSSDVGVSRDTVLAEMPTVDEVIEYNMIFDNVGMPHTTVSHAFNLFYALAAAAEKLQDYAKSLEYIDAALSTDVTRAGTQLPVSRAVFGILRGRVLAAAGRTAEAREALEGARAGAERCGVWVVEALALCPHPPGAVKRP